MANRKQSSFRVRCSHAQKQRYQLEAKLRRLSLSEYIRRSLGTSPEMNDVEKLHQQQQQLILRLLTGIQVLQSLTEDSGDPRLHQVITRLLEVAKEVGE